MLVFCTFNNPVRTNLPATAAIFDDRNSQCPFAAQKYTGLHAALHGLHNTSIQIYFKLSIIFIKYSINF